MATLAPKWGQQRTRRTERADGLCRPQAPTTANQITRRRRLFAASFSMPVTFRGDRSNGVIVTVARGIVSYAELVKHIDAKAKKGVAARAELFDARDVTLDLSLQELKQLAAKVKEAVGEQSPGKIAVVTNSAFIYGLARTYAELSRKDNPRFEVFSDTQDAQAWILENGVLRARRGKMRGGAATNLSTHGNLIPRVARSQRHH